MKIDVNGGVVNDRICDVEEGAICGVNGGSIGILFSLQGLESWLSSWNSCLMGEDLSTCFKGDDGSKSFRLQVWLTYRPIELHTCRPFRLWKIRILKILKFWTLRALSK